jgi:hypothetical protein
MRNAPFLATLGLAILFATAVGPEAVQAKTLPADKIYCQRGPADAFAQAIEVMDAHSAANSHQSLLFVWTYLGADGLLHGDGKGARGEKLHMDVDLVKGVCVVTSPDLTKPTQFHLK